MMRFAATVSLATWLCVVGSVVGADKPLVVELWPGKVPDETGNIGAEKFVMSPKLDKKQVEVTEPTRMVTNVTKPTITVFRPAKEKDTGAAVLICPGGGYWNLYWQLEGEEVAAWLNSRPACAFPPGRPPSSWPTAGTISSARRSTASSCTSP